MLSEADNQSNVFFAGADDFTRTYDLGEFEKEQRVACLCSAIKTGDLKIVKTLLDEGFDVNEVFESPEEDTYLRPLSVAVSEKHVEIVKLLIEKGAEVGNAPMVLSSHDSSEISTALQMKPRAAIAHILAFEAMRARSKGTSPIGGAQGSTEYLLSRSPLATACYVKSGQIVNILLDAGAEFGEYYYTAVNAALDGSIECTDAERYEIVSTILGARDRIGFDRFVKATDDLEQYVNGEWRRGVAEDEYIPAKSMQEKAFVTCDRLLTSQAYRRRLPLAQLLYTKYLDLTLDDIIDEILLFAFVVDDCESLDDLWCLLITYGSRHNNLDLVLPLHRALTKNPKTGKPVIVVGPSSTMKDEDRELLETIVVPQLAKRVPLLDEEVDIDFDIPMYVETLNRIGIKHDEETARNYLLSFFEHVEDVNDFLGQIGESRGAAYLASLVLIDCPDSIIKSGRCNVAYDSESVKRIVEFWDESNLAEIKNFLKLEYSTGYFDLMRIKASKLSRGHLFYGFDSTCGSLISKELSPVYLSNVLNANAIIELTGIFDNIKSAYRRALDNSRYLSDESKRLAIEKLDSIQLSIAGSEGPAEGLEGNLIIDDWNFIDNVNRLRSLEFGRLCKRCFAKGDAGQAVNELSSWVYNAYYNTADNVVILLAAYLLSPNYSSGRASVMNYAAIGRVIGHELSHAFDPNSSLDIFTSSPSYSDNIEKLKRQYEGMVPRRLRLSSPIFAIKNDFDYDKCIGENFADVVGLEISLYAYAISIGCNTIEELVNKKPEDVQRFMQSYAMSFRSKPSSERLERMMVVDNHAPDEFRANLVKNLDAFHTVFGTKEGDGMWLDPEERVDIFGIK